MKKKNKILAVGTALAILMLPTHLLANEGESNENLVCFYRENCKGELEYVCVDPYEPAPTQVTCQYECWGEE